MKLINQCTVIEKKSKFHGYLYELNSLEEVKIILEQLKNDNKSARHIPYAYIFQNTASKTDDKEPHNTAGIQILNALSRVKLNSHMLIIVRYYGGTKLGAPLLLRTYAKCANSCINFKV